ncbi:myosin head [Ostertagia ostertagi]
MSNLTFLNDASVLHNLRSRYAAMLIYDYKKCLPEKANEKYDINRKKKKNKKKKTYSVFLCRGSSVTKGFDLQDSVAQMFMGKRRTEMPPHLFAVSDEAYRNMLQNHENQSMLITGESGAGKTENTKKVIAYFAVVGASQQEKFAKKEETTEKKVTLEDQIVQTNPVLEAFGNAKTVRNNNSSRFGKFIRIHFSKQGRVASCDIEHYLLEKSRVIRQAPGERCYHIFYQLFSGFVPTLLKDYWFVAQAELKIDGVNDKEEFQLTDEAFDILKFTPVEKMNCYKLVAAMMHMGNMKFKQRPREEQAECDGTDGEQDFIRYRGPFKKRRKKLLPMYGIEPEDFIKALTRPRVKVNWAVGAMAKGLYSRIFHWLVKKCNQTLDQKGISRDYFIGVLDIAGFEIFDFNSFEQLWINFVNEKLQQFFNHHMFVLEQEEPLGIISMLDEECIVPKATDLTLAQKLTEQHLGKASKFRETQTAKGQTAKNSLRYRPYYAGTVRYNVTNWLEKNKDPLNDTVVQVMKNSKKNDLLVEVWQDYQTMEEAGQKGATAMLARLVKEKKLAEEHFRVGLTKVFFKAGILAHLEDVRDIRLAELMTGLQAQIRWYYQVIEKKRRIAKIEAMKAIQRNVRNWAMLRTWSWFKLYGKVKPLIQSGKIEEQYEKLQETVANLKETLEKEEALKAQLTENAERLKRETADLLAQLEATRGTNTKVALEAKLADANARLEAEETTAVQLQKEKKQVEAECAELKKQCQDIDLSLRKSEAEKLAKEHQIRSLQDEMRQQDEAISKLHKGAQKSGGDQQLNEDLQAAEDQNMASNKLKSKLMQTLEESEATLEREKRNRADMDKAKRKAEGDLKIAQEEMEELSKAKSDVENGLRRKETELHNLSMKLEDEQAGVAKLQKSIQQDEAKMKDLNDQLADEKVFMDLKAPSPPPTGLQKSKKFGARAEQQAEYDDLTDQLDEQSRATAAQIELGKKKDMEVAKLRRDLEEAGLKFGEQLATLKKKGADAVQELTDQVEQLQKQKNRSEKEKAQTQREFDEASAALDHEAKARAEQERIAKQHEVLLLELRLKSDEQSRQLQDFVSAKGRLYSENSDLARQVEELEGKIQAATRLKLQFSNELDQTRRFAEEEGRERQNLNSLSKNLARQLEQLREAIEDEVAGKAESTRQLQKAQVELDQWRTKFETEGLIGADEFDEVKKRQNAKTTEIQDSLDACNAKIVALENARSRLTAEADTNRLEAEHHAQAVASLEKKQKAFDKVIDEWKKKARDLSDQLGEGGRAMHELSKKMRCFEMEKEELQRGLDEAEAALEAEESKSLRCQIEVSQIRAEIEKRIAEKEEEFENSRKVHQQTIDSIQATLESETKSKAELFRVKKKLEADINELEIALDHANRANEDAQKNVRRYMDQTRELQQTIDEEQKRREEFRELLLSSERKLAAAKQEQEELIVKLEAIERARRVVEQAVKEHQEQNNELNSQNCGLAAAKSQLDNEIALLKSDIAEAQMELAASEERGRRAAADAAKMSEDLRAEQEHSLQVERYKKQLESQVKDMQERADIAEAAVMKGGAKEIMKAEARLKALQGDLETEDTPRDGSGEIACPS